VGVVAFSLVGWLVVLNRSGHVTQTATTAFLAPDDAPNAEGVAGPAWRRGALRVGRGDARLPDLSNCRYYGMWSRCWHGIRARMGSRATAVLAFEAVRSRVEQYAELTNTSKKFVWDRLRLKKPCPTSIVGILIRDHQKEPWGVLIMDSSNDYECIDTTEQKFRHALTTLMNKLQSYGIFGE